MSTESLALVPNTTVPPPPTTSSVPPVPLPTLPWTLADEESLTKRENAITHLQLCIIRRDQCELDLTNFRKRYSETVINADPILHSRHILLMNARREAYYAYFRAYDALYPKTIEDILWIMAKAGHTQLVAPLMNLSKVTRTCIHLQPLMMNVKWGVNQWTQLHYCAENGLTTSVKRLLSIRNIDVNVKDVYGWIPLHEAAINGHVEIVRLLLQKGADVNAREEDDWTSLHFAALEGHIEIARLLIQNGADVNARDARAWNPLHQAAQKGQVEILHLLVEIGADLESQTNSGYRALHIAVCNGQLSFIQELISKYNVDINARMNDGWTALFLARTDDEELDDNKQAIIAFIEANGGIDEDEEEDDD